jgi:hypothetical protein
METKPKRSPVFYAAAVLLLALTVIGIGFLLVGSIGEIMDKRRLTHGVQIMATVTDKESHFNIVRNGLRAYEIDYEFQYTDRQTGQIKKQVRTDYEVYQNEYAAYVPGSTFTASFIPADPAVNEPTAAVGRFSSQAVWLVRILTSLVFVSAIGALIFRLHHLAKQLQGSRKVAAIIGILVVALLVGLIVGGNVADIFEQILL